LKRRNPPPRWEKRTIKLNDKHSWKAPPGYNLFVADRGAVRFNYPHGWAVVPADDCIQFCDKQPPHDNCRLAVSYLQLPPVDLSGLPLAKLLPTAMQSSKNREVFFRGEPVSLPREDVEILWAELRFVDMIEQREAFSRIAMARGANLQALITFDYWVELAVRCQPIWDEVMRSVQLGRYIDDPAQGDVLH
jgi:hypothetical protein